MPNFFTNSESDCDPIPKLIVEAYLKDKTFIIRGVVAFEVIKRTFILPGSSVKNRSKEALRTPVTVEGILFNSC